MRRSTFYVLVALKPKKDGEQEWVGVTKSESHAMTEAVAEALKGRSDLATVITAPRSVAKRLVGANCLNQIDSQLATGTDKWTKLGHTLVESLQDEMATTTAYILRDIPNDLWDRVKSVADSKSMTLKDAILASLVEWVKKEG